MSRTITLRNDKGDEIKVMENVIKRFGRSRTNFRCW